MMRYPDRYRPSRLAVILGAIASLCIIGVFWDGDINALDAQTGRCPQYESALRERGLPVEFFSKRMFGESGCNPLAVNDNRRTGDLSLGLLQLNLFDRSTRDWFVANGFGYWNLTTVDGNLNATVLLYNRCGELPWRKPYGCKPPKHLAVYR